MGRLVLNVLLSFAQFEREIIAERTRDKIAAARRQGKWIGGVPVLGYDLDPVSRKRVVNRAEAKQVRAILALYLKHQGLIPVVQELARRGWTTKRWTTRKGRQRGGRPFTKTGLHHLLRNVVYIGKLRYRTELHAGEHEAIVEEKVWQRVQALLESKKAVVRGNGSARVLKGLLRCAACERSMCPSVSAKGAQRYHYYVCTGAQKRGWSACPSKSLPAPMVERLVAEQLQQQGLLGDDWQKRDAVAQGERLRTLLKGVRYDGRTVTLTIALRHGEGALKCAVPKTCRHVPPTSSGRLPRVSRWMALALHFDTLLRDGAIGGQRDLARLGQVSAARVSQILNLVHLAPDIQEQLLFLPPVHGGRDPVLLRQLQPLAAMALWEQQRRKWLRLLRRVIPERTRGPRVKTSGCAGRLAQAV
jgi:hypothetical protein